VNTLEAQRKIIQEVLLPYTRIPYSHGDIRCEAVFDTERDHYLLMVVGWDRRRIHGCLVHVDLIDGKFWIQRDGKEDGVATELEAAGAPKERSFLPSTPRSCGGTRAMQLPEPAPPGCQANAIRNR
jgi:hypothetical protein